MKCVKAQELFSSYLEKTIQPPMGVAFEQHLAECARCKADYEKFHATTVVLDELPQVEPPPDMHAAIMARIEEAQRTSPSRVKWLHFNWPNAFTLRVPARALAMSVLLLLVAATLFQFTPLQSITANLFGVNRHTSQLADDSGVAPMPMPWGAAAMVGAKHADVGGGLMMSVHVDARSHGSTVYILRLGAQTGQSIPVRVYLLSENAMDGGITNEDLTNVLYMGTVSSNQQTAVPVVMAGCAERKAQVALVTWDSDGRSFSELVFVPWTFESEVDAKNVDMHAGAYDVFSKLSADCGVVVLAPANKMTNNVTVGVDAAADDVLIEAIGQMGLRGDKLAPSVYVVK
ncbi:MAG: anti-sigma factor family protein [Armatimonadota bacterium]|jgi:hypothetical protein